MNILVTGATGFIGSHLAERLLKDGHNVRCLVRKTANRQWLTDPGFTFADGSITDTDSLVPAVADIDVIYHVAGLTAARSRQEFFKGNHEGTKNLLEAATRHGKPKRFVHVSSLAAVGPNPTATPIDETSPYHPITAYGESKRAAEEEVLKYADRLPITIVRPPAVYGPRDTGIFTFFQTINSGIFPLIGFTEKLASLVYVTDLVDGFVRAGNSDTAVGKIYFISSERGYTWQEIGSATKRVMHKQTVTLHVPHALVYSIAAISEVTGKFRTKPPIFDFEKGRDITQRFWTCSIAKATKDFGYRPSIDLETGIRESVDWYKKMRWL